MSLGVTILGCGSSGGVPRVGQGWGACDPNEPRNRRRRCSILIKQETAASATQVLVDASPDLREQLLGADLSHLDAVLLTHEHADHTHGLDDLRPLALAMRRHVDVHMNERTSIDVRRKFDYMFATPLGSGYPPFLRERRLHAGRAVTVGGAGGDLDITPFDVRHGDIDALGLRVGAMAYTPDVSDLPASALSHLQNLDLWIVDALRPAPHPTHFSLAEALGWIERLKPKRAVLTNMHNDLDYATLKASLPANVTPAYDGLTLQL